MYGTPDEGFEEIEKGMRCASCGSNSLFRGADTHVHCNSCGATQNPNHHKM